MGNVIGAADLAAEGLPTDARALGSLVPLAEACLERVTGFRFYAYAATFVLDGTGTGTLILPQPIVSLSSVVVGVVGTDAPLVAGTDYALRNRRPPDVDDRLYPRLERWVTASTGGAGGVEIGGWAAGRYWSRGTGNVTVTGTFGFTDLLNGAEVAPREVKRLCCRLVAFELARLGDLDAQMARRLDIYGRSFEGISLAGAEPGVGFGVPEIDSVVARYSHPAYAARPKFAFGGA